MNLFVQLNVKTFLVQYLAKKEVPQTKQAVRGIFGCLQGFGLLP